MSAAALQPSGAAVVKDIVIKSWLGACEDYYYKSVCVSLWGYWVTRGSKEQRQTVGIVDMDM